MKRKGFTLIELVIVVAIIGILALMIIPQFANVTRDAKYKTFQNNQRAVVTAIGMYQAANKGNYPVGKDSSSSAIDAKTVLAEYLNVKKGEWLTDPTGATYEFSGTDNNSFLFTAKWPEVTGIEGYEDTIYFPADRAPSSST